MSDTDAVERLGAMVEWQAEVIIDTRDALRVGGCTEHVLTAEQAGALEAATRILARERNADPSRYDLAIRERDDARAAIARVRALHVSVERPESEHYYCEPEECDQAGVGGMETVCDVCERLYPCPTIRALDVRHDPSAPLPKYVCGDCGYVWPRETVGPPLGASGRCHKCDGLMTQVPHSQPEDCSDCRAYPVLGCAAHHNPSATPDGGAAT